MCITFGEIWYFHFQYICESLKSHLPTGKSLPIFYLPDRKNHLPRASGNRICQPLLSARAPYCMYYNDAKVPGFISGPDTNYPVFSLNHVHVFTKCYYFLCVIMCMLLVALCMFDCGSFLTFSLEKNLLILCILHCNIQYETIFNSRTIKN